MTICGKINFVISVVVIVLAAVWFTLVVVISERPRDPRISKLGLLSLPIPLERQEWMYLHHVDLPELKKANFELIEIMNYVSPNILGDEVLLMISLGEMPAQPLYSHFIALLHRKAKNNEYLSPTYILRQFAPMNLNSEKNIHLYANQIKDALKYFLSILNIKKLSLLSYQESALITLFALSTFKQTHLFPRIDKVILINPFNPYITVYHSSVHTLVREIKRNIVQNKLRLLAFNQLRLVLISTTRTVRPKERQSLIHFDFLLKDTKNSICSLKNTIIISSRAMWHVYSFLHSTEYFLFDPFIKLLARFIIEDKKTRFNPTEIQNFFQRLYASQNTQNKHMRHCQEYSLGQKYREGDKIGKVSETRILDHYPQPCIKLSTKDAKDIIIYSEKPFVVYGQNYQKLQPMDNITHTIYHFQNIAVDYVYIVTLHKTPLHFSRGYPYASYSKPITPFSAIEQDVVQLQIDNVQLYHAVKLCEPATLIYPIHFRRGPHGLLLKSFRELNCYSQFDSFQYYPEWFLYNWNLIRNLMIFSLFCSQVLAKTNFERFCTQAFVNLIILTIALEKILLFQNLILLSTVTVVELCFKYAIKLSNWINFSGKYSNFGLLLPLVFDLAHQYKIYDGNLPSAWKVLTFQLWFLSSPSSILIVLIKLHFMIGPLYQRQGCQYGLLLICIWQYFALQEGQQHQKESNRLKRKIADIIFLFAIIFCIQEDGSVLHEIINFYIITHALLAINQKINGYFA